MRTGFAALLFAASVAGAQMPGDSTRPVTVSEIVVNTSRVGLVGRVVDSAGAAIENAEVRAYPGRVRPDSLLVRMSHHYVRSGPDGSFFMPLVPGAYVVRVTQTGFSPSRVDVTVPGMGERCIVVRLSALKARRGAAGASCTL